MVTAIASRSALGRLRFVIYAIGIAAALIAITVYRFLGDM